MSLTVYGIAASRAFRVLWAAEELGLSYEHVPYKFGEAEIKSAQYRAINPNAAIPAIVDDGFPLWESLAINLYLARKAGTLWPRGPARRGARPTSGRCGARPRSSRCWASGPTTRCCCRRAERKPQLAEEAARKLPGKLDVLEGVLAGREWLAGDGFTIADLNLAAVMFRAPSFGLERWPRIAAWHGRCYARPAAQRAIALREGRKP